MQQFYKHRFSFVSLDYLHDRDYVKRSDFDGKLIAKIALVERLINFKNFPLSAEIKHIKVYLSVTFVLVMILLILFIAVNGPKLFRSFRKVLNSLNAQKKKQKPAEPVTMANPNTESPKMRRNPNANQNQYNLNRTSSIFTVSGTEYDQKTVSTPISRHPAEDTLTSTITTNDYSYDNKALQLTPVSTEKPKIETNF